MHVSLLHKNIIVLTELQIRTGHQEEPAVCPVMLRGITSSARTLQSTDSPTHLATVSIQAMEDGDASLLKRQIHTMEPKALNSGLSLSQTLHLGSNVRG